MQTYEHNFPKNITALAYDLCHILHEHKKPPVFVCVGDSHLLADSLGAVVGQLLINNHLPCYVYGNLTQNIVNSNFESTVNFIKKTHPLSPIVIIDSALGQLYDVGRVKLTNHARIGAYTNPNAPAVSHTSILGFVNTSGINSLLFIKSVKLQKVLSVANFIAKSVYYAVGLLNEK